MKKVCLMFLLLLLTIGVNASGSISVTKNSMDIKEGGTLTFKVEATNAAGVIKISSSDESIITVSPSTYFFDTSLNNSSVDVNVKALKEGNAKVKVEFTDIATFDNEVLTGTREISVNVSKSNVQSQVINNVPKTDFNISNIVIIFSVIILLFGLFLIFNVRSKKKG